ncbi:hypothetical protein ACEZDB_13295 [Streptacidiphilus sp. N1-3]|uniref:CdiI immunity protein domain-containing protein n=1 Tax=Streptacidiphilus alkalitolerans TaxID=3342712 RepID=A0ABV6X086_9ACTN
MPERFSEFDFGVTGLAALFHEDWSHFGAPEDVVAAYLSPGDEPCAGELLRKEAAALESDLTALGDSGLDDRQIRMLWTAATGGNFRFRDTESGRDLLLLLNMGCRGWQQLHGVASVDTNPGWNTESLVHDLGQAVAGAELDLPDYYPLDRQEMDSMELRKCLLICSRTASVELAFRLLLRIQLANFMPIHQKSWAAYQRISRSLSLGEYVLSGLDFLVEGQ